MSHKDKQRSTRSEECVTDRGAIQKRKRPQIRSEEKVNENMSPTQLPDDYDFGFVTSSSSSSQYPSPERRVTPERETKKETVISELKQTEMPTVNQLMRLIEVLYDQKLVSSEVSTVTFSTKAFEKITLSLPSYHRKARNIPDVDIFRIYTRTGYERKGHGTQFVRAMMIATSMMGRGVAITGCFTDASWGLGESLVRKGLFTEQLMHSGHAERQFVSVYPLPDPAIFYSVRIADARVSPPERMPSGNEGKTPTALDMRLFLK